jgi:hypothetical protein
MFSPLPGLPPLPRSQAAWPCWSDSTRRTVRFTPLAKREAVRLFHKARRFERGTRQRGRQDGALGRNGLAVLHALLFDFLNYASGRLDPSYARIAEKACISVRSVARGLVRLRDARVLDWVRRCREGRDDLGRFRLEQESNAYGVLPASQWRGFHEPLEPPPPHSSSWGAAPPLPDVVAQATADRRAGGSQQAMLAVLESDPGDPLGAVLARLGRAILGPTS